MKRIINGKQYNIKPRLGEHYEVYDDRGAFLFSADNYWEIERELEEKEVE